MSKMTFERRRQGLIDKAGGGLLVDLARDAETNQPVGYCVTTISDERVGEIDSIYVEREYRRHRIADTLMKRALSWLDGHSVLRRVLTVAGGNEQVLEFYARYGFYPRSTVLEQITERPDLAKT
jgi:ribosomal protein S18 acetylase RimI-like enzyme